MAKKIQRFREAPLLFPLSRRLVAKSTHTQIFLKPCKHNKRKKACVKLMNDLLSHLPDEIIIDILSRLTMKEVAKISLLSRKWRRVWQCYPILNFEASRPMPEHSLKCVNNKEKQHFVSRVNHIVDQHVGQDIDEFRVSFNLDDRYRSHVDNWITFAFAKQVKRLELDFTPNAYSGYEQYAWPVQNHMFFELRHHKNSWKHALRSLCLKSINVTSEAVEYLLISFPFLEILCICEAYNLTSIRACSSLPLKRLEVISCEELNTIDVDAPKLLSFCYEGHPINLHLRNVSSLSVVSIGSFEKNNFIFSLDSCSNYYAQLEYLELKIHLPDERDWQTDQWPEFTKLKHFTLYACADYESSLLGWTSLINASPVLQKLTLKLRLRRLIFPRRTIQKVDGHPLGCLKTFEIIGSMGHCADLEFAMYVLENAIMLEEVVLDARYPCQELDPKPYLKAQKRAMELSSKLPQGVKLVFK